MKISSLGRAARSQAGIKVRQPLAVARINLCDDREPAMLERVKPQVLEELNIKSLEYEVRGGVPEEGYVVSTDGGYAVAVPTEISPELLKEGMAREIVHCLQTMRRAADFDIADHIATCYQGDDYVTEVMESFADYIKQETLSRELSCQVPAEGAFTESYKLSGREVLLGVRRLD
jgi:isoleucyl-tRNA synthetase